MVVRIPGPDESVPFGPPVAAPAAADPFADLPDGTKDAMRRMQARDDALFIATALADLTSRHRAASRAAEHAAVGADEDPAMRGRRIEGFARRLDAEFAADVERTIQETQSLSGPRPSEDALALFRRRADAVRRGALARNAIREDGLRRTAQMRSIESGIDGLAAAVEAEPEELDEALGRLADLTGAAAGLMGREDAAAFDRDARMRLAASAARSLIAQDPGSGLEAIRSGAYDDQLDEDTRSRLLRDAEALSQAAARDGELLPRRQAVDDARRSESRALAFLGDFRRRLAAGEVSHAGIAAAEADGTLTPARAEALRAELDRSQTDRADDEAKLRRVGESIRNGAPLDAAKPEDRAAAALYFDRAIEPGLAELPPRQRADAIADYVSVTGIAPAAALRSLAGLVIAGDPADRVYAAKVINDLMQRDAPVGDALPPGVVRLSGDLATSASFRIPPAKAVEMAESGKGDFLDRHAPDDVPPVDETDIAQLTDLQSRLESEGKPGLASLLGKFLDILRRGRSIKPPPQQSRPRQQEPDDQRSDPGTPRPKAPVPPIQREHGENPDERPAPGPGHNGPPSEDQGSGVRGVELRPGVTVRGDPNSKTWSRFTGALDRLTGKSREAADGLVNGGELTTSTRAGDEVSNLTRRGTLEDSHREFDKAVERAGGTATDIKFQELRNGEMRSFVAEDGTRFQHRTESRTGPPTVDIHIEWPHVEENAQREADQVKIRFVPPGAPEEGSEND